MSRTTHVASHPLSASTHVTPWSMADYQALLLNLHGRSFSSLSPPTTHHCQNQITTTTTIKTQPKSNRNKNPEAHQITNQITPTEIKAQNPQTQPKSQNENTESEPTIKKTYIGFVIIF